MIACHVSTRGVAFGKGATGMGLLDGILSNVAGSVDSGSQQQGSNPLDVAVNSLGAGSQTRGNDLLGAVMSIVQQNGGLPGIVNTLRNNGLGQQADSWVGTGPNAGVSPEQMKQVFGGSGLGNLASQLGTSPGQAGSILSQILPELVNQLTPNGQIPENHSNLIQQGLSLLRR
jgi:uncharacterized protein YidB (DUF937 family)